VRLSPTERRIVERVVNAFETGNADGDYAAISIYSDGPHDIRQITYGRSQTTEFGNLRQLVHDYAAARGRYSESLARYANAVGSRPLADDREFRSLLRAAGADPVMRSLQDQLFERGYYVPALQWARDHGLTLPLSALVVYDSFIQSGSMLWVIRESFPETLPVDGGGERTWLAAYVTARERFLATHRRQVVRTTVYRTRCLLREIERGNWHLNLLPIEANGVLVHAAR
jgi:chitosanase